MKTEDIAALTRCGACGGTIDRLNLVCLRRKARWDYPVAGNVLTGEEGEAVAVLCDACVDSEAAIREAVEFRGEEVIYHALDSLEPMPPEKTYRLVGPEENGAFGIECLRCGLTSWHPEDVTHRYCGNCHQFHNEVLHAS